MNCLKGREPLDHACLVKTISEARSESESEKASSTSLTLRNMRSLVDKKPSRKLGHLQEKGAGARLSTTPSFSCGKILPVVNIRSDLRDWHGLPLLSTPPRYDDYGAKFSMSRGLDCKVVGSVKNCCIESRDSLTRLTSACVCPSSACDEPLASLCRGAEELAKLVGLPAGLPRGFWESATDCAMDVRICDVNQPSCLGRSPTSMLKFAEAGKKKKMPRTMP